MRTIETYIDTAQRTCGLRSDRELSKRLSCAPNIASLWRTRRAWPSDTIMIHLAALAGIDPAEALLDLAIWRTSDEARPVYQRLMDLLTKNAAAVLLGLSITASLPHAGHATTTGTNQHIIDQNYTLCDIRRRLIRWLAKGLLRLAPC